MQDEDRLKKAVNSVPSHAELNVMLARSEEERVRFDRMDANLDWPGFEGAPPPWKIPLKTFLTTLERRE